MLSVGEHLLDIAMINDSLLVISTKENIHLFKSIGDWGHEAWIESISKIFFGEILEIRNDGWHFTIITTTGYNDIELRVEWGYGGYLKEMINQYDKLSIL